MRKFKVHIMEMLGRAVCVEAEDFDEARDVADELCNLDIIHLNGKDFLGRVIDILGEVDDDTECTKVYTRDNLKNEVGEYETDEEIFRRIQRQYRIEDAERHCKDLGYINLDDVDFENIADEFLNNYDCNIPENDQFENIINNYVSIVKNYLGKE